MKKLLGLLFILPSISFAVDGVFEINQLCATTTGCFAGDAPGFPVTINATGSYRLTGNLNISDLTDPEDVTAIIISGFNTTIDLNGFGIIGPVSCIGTTVTSCTPSGGTGHGIEVTNININSVTTIKNGSIRGMGLNGISSESTAVVQHIRSINNGGVGIRALQRSKLTNNHVLRNGAEGIVGGVIISDNIVHGNAATAITPIVDAKVIANRIRFNGDDGIDCSSCSAIENIVSDNEGFGIVYSGRPVAGGNLIDTNDMGNINGFPPFEIAPNRCGVAAC